MWDDLAVVEMARKLYLDHKPYLHVGGTPLTA